jgi:hypothetical protein
MHYAAAYGGGHRMYMSNEVDQNHSPYIPRIHHPQNYTSQNMPVGPEGSHGLGIQLGKVEQVSTPMGTAW